MNFISPFKKSEAICNLAPGDSLVITCGDRSIQSIQSEVNRILSRKLLLSEDYYQAKAMIIVDDKTKPVIVNIVTRKSGAR
ncbi:hypothetical protein GCM10009425_41130 [Pseudomonas asuensis]|uniref:Uncharacterized protein n=1 Tax=Pseudomonas asuensis TaxID=1825787 RepID=A0ABQ2H2R4_9PSED|nr:hypothetical protein GCM10009425_41130 [Pseudomonas asuensis]